MNACVVKTERWDWFSVPFEWGKEIGHVPGVVYVQGSFRVHRSHLPLLRQRPGVAALLQEISLPLRQREDREARAGMPLRPWQHTGLDFLEPRRGALLADTMRMGKTLTSLLTHDPDRGPLLVVGPLDTRAVWLRWFEQLWPGVAPAVVEGKTIDADKLTSSPIVFGHYDILINHQSTRLRPGTMIIDEIHLLSNPTSQRSRAVLWFASAAHRVVGLSGTPLWNMQKGLWAVMAAVNPGAWGRPFTFAQRYAGPELTEYGWKYRGLTNAAEWRARRDEVVLGRTWAQVRPDLPPIARKTHKVPLDVDAQYQVDLVAGGLLDKAASLIDLTVIARYRQAVGRFKVDLAVDLIKDLDEPVVVWCWHKEIVRAIADRLGARAMTMTGDQTGARRAKVIDAWNATPDGVLIATLPVGQVGIDLSHARIAVFVEQDWTPAVVSQAEMRTFHPDRPMEIHHVVLDHEVDQALLSTLLTKVDRGRALGMAAAGSTFGEADTAVSDEGDVLRELGELLMTA